MIDLSPSFKEATSNIQKWFARYERTEYPHKIVINIMYRAYTMNELWKEFEKQGIPYFNDLSSCIIQMEGLYRQTALTKVNANLLQWLQTQSERYVGSVSYQRLENLAVKAETDSKALEELEFTYIFELLNDKCSLYWLALSLAGQTQTQAIGTITGILIENLANFNYSLSKQVFQQLRVAKYMNDNYIPFSHR